jgi:hypothetical protein
MIQQPAPSFDPEHDLLSALTLWVEKGISPTSVIATKYNDGQPQNGIMPRPKNGIACSVRFAFFRRLQSTTELATRTFRRMPRPKNGIACSVRFAFFRRLQSTTELATRTFRRVLNAWSGTLQITTTNSHRPHTGYERAGDRLKNGVIRGLIFNSGGCIVFYLTHHGCPVLRPTRICGRTPYSASKFRSFGDSAARCFA